MNTVFQGYLRLARPANLPTAVADILAGSAVAGAYATSLDFSLISPGVLPKLIFLMASSVCLYAAGVVLNDVFDVEIDREERPERPIPSGTVSLKSASFFGISLLLIGVLLAFLANDLCGVLALTLALAIVLYDSFSKRYALLGPMNMGICRGLNLILGMGIFGELIHWYYAGIPLVYIAAITLISRGEVHGNNKKHLIFTGILYAIVILSLMALQFYNTLSMLEVIPFLILFAVLVYKPLWSAYRNNSPENIKRAVISGVLSLIVLDAAIAVGFSNLLLAGLIVLLLPLSLLLSKLFAVT